MMEYIPKTLKEEGAMLDAIGVASFDDLLEIPAEFRLNRPLDLPAPLSQMELHRALSELAAKNDAQSLSFLGGGSYDHFIPSTVGHLLSRSEFATAYTPYQAEMSQGSLQAIYEYQSMICQLTGMEVANASLYDGASALAEGALMAIRVTRRNEIVVARTVHPHARQVLATYLSGTSSARIREVPFDGGETSLQPLSEAVTEKTAAVLIQHPNFFGQLEQIDEIAKMAHLKEALLVMSVDPISLPILKTPGEYQADIVVGEGQGMGNAIALGGPYVGFFASRREFIRQMPGRIVGRTTDAKGHPGFCLTLQTREQHIRRERATSNICTNQALCALAATIYMATLGKEGMREVATLCLTQSHVAREKMLALPGVTAPFPAPSQGSHPSQGPQPSHGSHPFFKEFVVRLPFTAGRLVKRLSRSGIFAGIALGQYYRELSDHLLICVTEKHTHQDIDRLIEGCRLALK